MSYAVDYMITALCNLKCPFCYGPDPTMPGEIDRDAKLVLLKGMIANGATHVIFGGGEPLISPHIIPAINTAHDMGARIGLQTNAFSSTRLLEALPFLDWIGLPIDGVNVSSQSYMRTTKMQLDRTQKAVDTIRHQSQYNPKIKIGTVITPATIEELPEIARIVSTLRPDIWKWYEVRPRGNALNNYDHLKISRELIQYSLNKIRKKFPDLNIFCSFVEQGDGAYLIVNPDSEALIPQGESYLRCGHLINSRNQTTFDEAVWSSYVRNLDRVAHQSNMKSTFLDWMQR